MLAIKSTRVLGVGVVAGLAAFATACATEVGEQAAGEPAIDKAESALENGDAADPTTDQYGGFVLLSMDFPGMGVRRFCSGVLISNDRFLTAEHCLTNEQTDHLYRTPERMIVSMGSDPSAQQVRMGKDDWLQEDPEHDYALVQVDSPFTMPQSDGTLATDGYQRPIPWHGDTPDAVRCFGSSGGTLREGDFQAASVRLSPDAASFFWRYDRNDRDQLPEGGDSGGACVLYDSPNGLWAYAGLLATHTQCGQGFCNGNPAAYAYFDSWSLASF